MIVHLSFFWGTIGFRTFRKCQWISETLRVSGIFRVVNESKVADWICHFGHDPNLYPFSTDCKRYQMLRVHFLCFFCSEPVPGYNVFIVSWKKSAKCPQRTVVQLVTGTGNLVRMLLHCICNRAFDWKLLSPVHAYLKGFPCKSSSRGNQTCPLDK